MSEANVKSLDGSIVTTEPEAGLAAMLHLMLAGLKACQPADPIQSFTIFSNGRAMAMFSYGAVEFDSPEHVERLLKFSREMKEKQIPQPA